MLKSHYHYSGAKNRGHHKFLNPSSYRFSHQRGSVLSFISLKIPVSIIFAIFFAQGALASNQCGSLFQKKAQPRIIEIPSKEVRISPIQNIEWLKRMLIKNGELEKLKKSDLFNDHNEFLSEILFETVKILDHDFYKNNSELKYMVGARTLHKTIIGDIGIHRAYRKVTHEYFVQINYAISKFVSLKNIDGLRLETLKAEIELAKNQTKFNEILENLKKEKEINLNLKQLSSERMLLFPTFADLKMKDFLELGIEIVPVGMSMKAEISYDNIKDDHANSYFMHDVFHGQIIMVGWEFMNRVERAKFLKIQRFLKSKSSNLTYEEQFMLDAYVFEKIHEYGLMSGIVSQFYGLEKFRKDGASNLRMITQVYNKLMDHNNYHYEVGLSRDEYRKTLESALKITIADFQKEKNL